MKKNKEIKLLKKQLKVVQDEYCRLVTEINAGQPDDVYNPSDVYKFVVKHRGWMIYHSCCNEYVGWYGSSSYDKVYNRDKDLLVDQLMHLNKK